MKLIDELQAMRDEAKAVLEHEKLSVLEHQDIVDEWDERLRDLELALAALQPGEPVTDEQTELFEPQEIEAPAQADPLSAELHSVPGEAEESRGQFEEEAELAAAIELTADVMPESGLHDDHIIECHPFALTDEQTCEPVEEAPALNADMQDEREQPVTDVAALIASGEHSYDEVAAIAYPEPDGYAPVTNPEAHIQAVEAERYAQPTNPEADALARAHDWYDPKAVAERQKFNPFGIFGHKRETEDA